MIDFAAHAIVLGGGVVALGLAAFLILGGIGEAIDTCREARDTAAEAKALRELYAQPRLEARGTVIEVEPLLDRLHPLDRPVGMVGGDGWRNR